MRSLLTLTLSLGWAGKAPYDDLYMFDLETNTWSQPLTTYTVSSVGPRCGHSCCAVDGGIVVIGGWDGNSDLDNIRTFNTATLTWESEQRHQEGSTFLPRHGHTALTVGNHIHVYGGSSSR